MKEYIKMIAVLSAITAVCGFLLASIKTGTEERIEEQILLNVKGPAVSQVLKSSTNDLIKDRKEVVINDKKYIVFIGKKDNDTWAITFESSGGGFGGDIGVMVGYNLEDDILTGIGITTHKETPGLGSKVAESSFTNNFVDKSITDIFKIKSDDGIIDAVTGATISSKAVCSAVQKSVALYPEIKEKILEE